ncbi:MAG TPA: hypothetical protein DCX14_11395 [Flavobacteriales bacterium]|nr:hypothetical protein [Flavobacteriales bacterium]
MKAIPVIVLSILLFSCDQKETIQNEPMALLEMAPTNAIKAVESSDSFEYGSFSRLQYSDDVDVLYEALLAKNERLRSLESSIEKLNSTVADQKDDWIAFKSRNEDYYLAATNYLESITDSTLKEEIAQQIEGSQDRYKSKRDQGEDKWSKLSNQINQLRNNQIALKITLTIPIIESYQGAKSESVVDLKPLIDAQVEIVSEMEELLELT